MTSSRTTAVLRFALAAVAALSIGFADAAAAEGSTGRPQPLSHDVDLHWAPSTRILTGTESIEFRNIGPGALPVIWLRLWPNDSIRGQADGCRRPRLRIRALEGAIVARYAVACSAVALELSRPLATGETATVKLGLTARAPRSESLFGRSAGVDLFGRVVPVMAVRDSHGWHLDPDTAVGDPAFSLAAAWRATIRMPAWLDAASTGAESSSALEGGERVVRASTPRARDFGFAIGRLRHRSATVDGVRVRVLFSSRTSAARARQALGHARDAVRAYSRWYGAYGSPELDLVITGLGESSQEVPEIVFTDPDRATVAHEVAHQWFYAIVGNDQFRSPWLDESFASWSEAQLVPGHYECDRADPLGRYRGWLGRSLAFFEDHPEAYVDVVYERGACALSVLARALGRRRFLALLATEVSRHRYGVIDTAGFLDLVKGADPAVAARWARLTGLSD
ncbi:MAG: hypothetical protein H0V29_03665 [Thermoleophilaceae bacterium]|nr:hypothetical protein [Thermoleophilaceae bacterium]